MRDLFILCFLLLCISYGDDRVHAVKAGFLSHSTGPISSGTESGMDLNIELLFKDRFLLGYPSLGADINLNGDTSFLYTGLSWEGKFYDFLHLGAFFGFAVHNGDLENTDKDSREYGTRVLFREALDIGIYIRDDLALSFMYDHYSNAGLTNKKNQGNDNIGLRLSYYF